MCSGRSGRPRRSGIISKKASYSSRLVIVVFRAGGGHNDGWFRGEMCEKAISHAQKRLLPPLSPLLEGECVRSAVWLSHQGARQLPPPPFPASFKSGQFASYLYRRTFRKRLRAVFFYLFHLSYSSLSLCFLSLLLFFLPFYSQSRSM